MNNEPLTPKNNETETLTNTSESTENVETLSNDANMGVHPKTGNLKDMHGIDTTAFKKSDGPRVESNEKNELHAEAFNKDRQVEKIKVDENRPEKSKSGLIIFLVLLLLFVIFLPDIKPMINKLMYGGQEENIVDGELRCKMKKTTNNFDISYEQILPFKSSRLQSLKYIETTKGDMNKDKEELEKLNNSCEALGTLSSNVEGLTINCEFTGETVTNEQIIDYSVVDEDKLTSAYAEANGVMPEFKFNQDIDEVQKKLQAAGYTCTKIK